MSLGVAWNNVFSLDRQRARYESERVNGEEERETSTTSPPTENNSGRSGVDAELAGSSTSTTTQTQDSSADSNDRTVRRDPSGELPSDESEEEDTAETFDPNVSGDDVADRLFAAAARGLARDNTATLAELEEQRELSRRRSSACVLLAVFVLFRLWIECIQTQDPSLLLLCLLGTSWTARWIRYNREREEELDRRIEHYLQNNNNNNSNTEVDRNEYARLSFQAQLALAIMESQRHMMEGGYGRPDGYGDQSPGVSDEAKARWKQFQWKQSPIKKGDYGALPKTVDSEMDNHCSICLGEYEDLETLTQLPCQHIYHDECIKSWTSNHVKCPLCNMDLESTTGGGESIV